MPLSIWNWRKKHAEKIAARWTKDVKSNAKTPSYKNLKDEDLHYQCVRFLSEFQQDVLDEKMMSVEIFSQLRSGQLQDGYSG